jgi:DNA anti-recombination protein RmuC
MSDGSPLQEERQRRRLSSSRARSASIGGIGGGAAQQYVNVSALQQSVQQLSEEKHALHQRTLTLDTNLSLLHSQMQRLELHYQAQLQLKQNESDQLIAQLKKAQTDVIFFQMI